MNNPLDPNSLLNKEVGETKMICPNCNRGELEIQDVLVSRTTDPKDDDLWEKMYYCPNCEAKLPIYPDDEGEEND